MNTRPLFICPTYPLFKTIEQMSKCSGIGENTLRNLIKHGDIEYIAVGNKKLIADYSIIEWYERNKIRNQER